MGVKIIVQHTKSYIQSEEIKEALGHLYNEIESLEREVDRKIRDLEDKIRRLEK